VQLSIPNGQLTKGTLLDSCLVSGIGVSADPARGAALHKQAADGGLPRAQSNSAVCLEDGTGAARTARRQLLHAGA
jgi:TPR repeat protein